MGELRALVVDAVILKRLHRKCIVASDFVGGAAGEACRIGLRVRKAYLVELEAKLPSEVSHPLGGPGGDYRRAMRAQVAHWIQVLQGEAPVYRPFLPR